MVIRHGLVVTALLLCAASASNSQIFPSLVLRGTVLVELEDRTRTPVPDALVEFFSIKWGDHWSVKTDKNGHYQLTLLDKTPFLILISGPDLTPMWANTANLSASMDFVTYPGLGNRLSPSDVSARRAKGASKTVEAPAIDGLHQTVTLGYTDRERSHFFNSGDGRLAAMKIALRKLKEESDAAKDSYDSAMALKLGGEFERSLDEFGNLLAKYGESKDKYFAKIARYCLVNMSEAHYLWAVDLLSKGFEDQSKLHFIKAVDFGEQYLDRLSQLSIVPPESKSYGLVAERITATSSLNCVKFLKLMEFKKTALEMADRAAAEDRDHRADWELLKARTYVAAGDRDAALEGYKTVLALDRKNTDALYELSLELIKSDSQDDLKQAADYLERFIKLVPETDDRVDAAKQAIRSLDPDAK